MSALAPFADLAWEPFAILAVVLLALAPALYAATRDAPTEHADRDDYARLLDDEETALRTRQGGRP